MFLHIKWTIWTWNGWPTLLISNMNIDNNLLSALHLIWGWSCNISEQSSKKIAGHEMYIINNNFKELIWLVYLSILYNRTLNFNRSLSDSMILTDWRCIHHCRFKTFSFSVIIFCAKLESTCWSYLSKSNKIWIYIDSYFSYKLATLLRWNWTD